MTHVKLDRQTRGTEFDISDWEMILCVLLSYATGVLATRRLWQGGFCWNAHRKVRDPTQPPEKPYLGCHASSRGPPSPGEC